MLMDKGLTRTRGDEVFLLWLDLKRRLNVKQRLDPSLTQGEGLTRGQPVFDGQCLSEREVMKYFLALTQNKGLTQGEGLIRGQLVFDGKGLTRTRGDEVFLLWLDLKRKLNVKQGLTQA